MNWAYGVLRGQQCYERGLITYEGSVSLPETRPLCIVTVAQAHGLASHAHGNELGL